MSQKQRTTQHYSANKMAIKTKRAPKQDTNYKKQNKPWKMLKMKTKYIKIKENKKMKYTVVSKALINDY